MTIFALKLVLTPLLIALVSLAGRRWGPAVSGLIVGLPLTSGPVSLFFALEQGTAFASEAAIGTLVGIAAFAPFCIAYTLVARRFSWLASALAALASFVLAIAVLGALDFALVQAFALAITFLGATFLLSSDPGGAPLNAKPPRWDIPLRMVVATSFVVILTGAAAVLGPQLSGLLSPIPVFSTTLAAFTHKTEGPGAATRQLKGTLLGLFSFAIYFFIVGGLLPQLGIAWTYTIAVAAALLTNAAAYWLMRRRPQPAQHA